jgi:hypothetical protein
MLFKTQTRQQNMEFNPNNHIIILCMQGMEGMGKTEEAGRKAEYPRVGKVLFY